jgi:hypothetical protein
MVCQKKQFCHTKKTLKIVLFLNKNGFDKIYFITFFEKTISNILQEIKRQKNVENNFFF